MTINHVDESELPISPPKGDPSLYDQDWREKIALAKRERDAARKARKGKPVSFPQPTLPRGK